MATHRMKMKTFFPARIFAAAPGAFSFPGAALVFSGLLSLFLTGCLTPEPPPRARLYDPEELGTVPQLNERNTPVALAARMPEREYWKALGDAQLDRLIEQALAGAPNIRAADARIRQAAALVDAARGATRPRADVNLTTTYEQFPERWIIPPPLGGSWDTDNLWTLNASLDLDLWDKLGSAVHGATARHELAKIEGAAVRISLSASLARAWVELDRLYRQRDLLDRVLEARAALEKMQAQRVEAGLDADFDRTLQRQSIASLQGERTQLEEHIGLQRNLIAALAGQGPDWGAKLDAPKLSERLDAVLPSTIPADLLGRRPDVAASRWRIEAAGYDVEVAEKQFYPDINLSAFLGLQSISLDQLFKSQSLTLGVTPALHLPIFDAGRLQANLEMKAADYDAAVETYNATLVDALRDVFDQARSLDSAQRQSADAARAMAAVRRNAGLVDTRFGRGLVSKINLLLARLQVMAQQRVEIDLRARRLDAALSLERALGGGFLPEQGPFQSALQIAPPNSEHHPLPLGGAE